MKNFLLMAALGFASITSSTAQTSSGNPLNQSQMGDRESIQTTRSDEKEYWYFMQEADSYAGGTGTEADPYLIETPEQLLRLQNDADGELNGNGVGNDHLKGVYFKQIADIDLSKYYSNGFIIGLNGWFSGNYDGNGYTIKGYKYVADATSAYQDSHIMFSLFGNVQNAVIKNVTIEDYVLDVNVPDAVNSTLTAGQLAAIVNNSQIENCTTTGEIKFNTTGIGITYNMAGVVGLSGLNTVINNCQSNGTIDLNMNYKDNPQLCNYLHASGITAQAETNVKIINCISNMSMQNNANGSSAAGAVVRSSGIAGWTNSNVQILNCGNTGSLSAKGNNAAANTLWVQVAGIGSCILNSTVNNCWNAGNLHSEGHLEGQEPLSILCYWENVTKNNCYYNREAENAVGSGTDKGLAASYMQSEAFVSDLNENLPEGGKEWSYREGDYPTLRVEESTPDANEQIHVSNTTFRLTPEGLEINAEQATEMAIYTMQGIQKTARQIPAGTTSIALAPGIYILQLNGEGHKIVIR